MTNVAESSPLTNLHLSGYTLVECIYQGTRTTVYRAVGTATQQSVVVKILAQEYPNFSELVQFRNQYTVAKNLPIEGIIRPLSLETWGNGYALIMEDFGGIDLGQYAQGNQLSLIDILTIAIQLATILHDLHQHRVIHKDIKPANILIHPDSKQVKLSDFSLASLLPKETEAIKGHNSLEGTLAYLAPEQTGRMNRAIDYRTDFYSLGVTLYQLLTGQLPFTSKDPLELIHCHMAQLPAAVDQINPDVPAMVTAIIAKLMAKNAEDRYQSAFGLKYDFERCLTQWQQQGEIAEFSLGQQDLSDRFLIPEKLYGRETEVKVLLNAFDRVAQSSSELMLVTGFSGIGKTAVVNEVHKPITRQKGYFIKGKFDQFNRNIPLSAFLQALRDLMGQLLSESDAQLKTWKTRILDAVGENGKVLVDVIPELAQIIGNQPSVIELSGSAAQNRFNRLFQNFIELFSIAEHPLVIFLDDLQWADSTSLQLIKLLAENNRYLLLIGAYRDNEVSSTHPLTLTLGELKQAQSIVNTITLTPLSFEDTNHLIADTLNCSTKLAQPLTELVNRKTKGNPFFTTQFLKALHEDGLLSFDLEQRYWACDITQIKAMALTDDVVEFMVVQLRKLSVETQQVLKLAACIGNQFDLNTLAIVLEESSDNTAQFLWQALQEGFVLPTSQIYKFFQSEDDNWQRTVNPTYQFLHDRVQQAAYCLIPDTQKQITHLKIGQLLLDSVSEVELDNKLFNIVNHWNIGAALVTDAYKQTQLRQLNFKAAYKAKGAIAYEAAHQYATTAIDLLSSDSWSNQYSLTLALYELVAELAYLKGDFAKSQHWAKILLHHAKAILDEVKVHEINLLACTAQKKTLEATELGLQTLEKLGISIPNPPTQDDIEKFWTDVGDLILQTKIQSLLDLPSMTDDYALAALRILNSMAATVYLTQPQLFPLIVLAQVKLSLLHGNTPVSAGAYARYSFLLCSKVNDIELGYEFGCLALKLSEKFNNKAISTRVLLMVGALTLPWKVHLKESIPLLKTAYLNGLESGNLDGAALSHYYESQSSYIVGEQLQELAHKVATYSQQIREIKQELHFNNNELIHQVILNLTGNSQNPYQLVGNAFNEETMLPLYHRSSNVLGLFCLYLHKAMLCYWFGEWNDSVGYATEAAKHLAGSTAQATGPLLYFYDSLARLAQYATVSNSEQNSILAKISENQVKIKHWADHAPMNFQHKYDLVLAEQYHCLGEMAAAIDVYDSAISGAKVNGYIQEEAMANELAARFYLDWGKEKIAAVYMQEAYYCYSRWGASAKVADLESRYPKLLRPILQQLTTPSVDVLNTLTRLSKSTISAHFSTHHKAANRANLNQAFDFASILKASQALSSAIKLDELLYQLTQIILQNSGGDHCALILPDETGVWQVRAVATSDKTQLYTEPLTNNPNIPVKLIQYVKNTQKVVVIDNLETDLPILDDYLMEHQPKSLLCLPLFNQGHLVGILYLSNRLTDGVFTSDRITILNFLCTQTAISLENARLYQLEKRRADQLAASEDRLQTLFDQAADAVFLLREQKIIDCNQAAVSLFRYPNKAALLALQIHQFSPERQPDGQLSAVKIEFMLLEASQRCSFRFKWVCQCHNGEDFWAEITLTPIKYQGKIIFHCIARDISDRKKLEKEQARLTAVLEATPDFIGVATTQGEILWHNKPLRNLRKDLVESDEHHLISDCHPDWVNEIIVNEALPSAVQNGSWSGELVLLDEAGREIPVSQVIIAHKDGSGAVENFSTIMRDISDRKQAEANSRLLASVVESSDDAIITKNLDSIITSWNHAAVDLFGYTEAEAMGQPITMLFPADRLQEEAQIIARIKNKKRVKHFETIRLHKDGSPIDISVTISPLIDSHGNVIGASKIVRDIRDRKQAEAQIHKKNQALKMALTQLQQSQLQLVKSEKMSALGGLVTGIAHEINNPVGCIVGNVAAAQDYFSDLLGLLDLYAQQFPNPGPDIENELDAIDLTYVRDDLPQLIQAMKDSGKRIVSISRSLRTFSRADTETRQVFDLHKGLESTVLILRHRLKANEQRPAIEVVKDYGDIPEITCFPGQLNQVFMNILANAIDALDETSQTLSFADLDAFSPCITIRTEVDNQQIMIAIADNGPGIPEALRSKVFDSLFTTKDVGKGTGLGLAIAHQIVVDTHGGRLDVQSEIGQGTEFCIRLPLQQQ